MRHTVAGHPRAGGADWWRQAVFYQVYVSSFADSNGDGIGDLDGITERMGYLELLGVDALWLTPFYRSPMVDHGYDVAHPRDVDPLFGDLAAFDRMLAHAHQRGLRVIIDLVPNHTSAEHPWFAAAVGAGPGSPARDRYVFADGRGDGPPNNWVSAFGGPAWTQVADGQWYLHLFSPAQPDLNWDNAEVRADFDQTLRFWLDRGVDGFRIDVAHGLVKPPGLPDMSPHARAAAERSGFPVDDDPRWDADGVHEVHRGIRARVDEYPDRMLVGEVWVRDEQRFARYVRPEELHCAFNFALVGAPFDADRIRAAIDGSLAAVAGTGAPPTWTLSNHDVPREVTRYGGGEAGVARARAMALVELALPGVVFVYNGAELGLADVDLPDWALRDPTWERSGHTRRGRDGCRVPLPWEGTPPCYGFTTAERSWLPMPGRWEPCTVAAQLESPDSTLSLYRRAIELRRACAVGADDGLAWYQAPSGCLAFRRTGSGLTCALNASERSVARPPGELLLASGPIIGDRLPPNTAVWLAPRGSGANATHR